ncbi:response regulator transcription factor [Sutcliffiella halmapala]
MAKILVVEDEDSIRSLIALHVKRAGHHVLEASSAEAAIDIIKHHTPLLALLDIMLPGIDGLHLCRYIKKEKPSTGIIMLTAKTQEDDKITGLKLGADDYIAKPFSPKELLARMEAVARRLPGQEEQKAIHSGPFTLDLVKEELSLNQKPVSLTPTEYGIIKFLIEKSPIPLSRDDILDKVWGKHYVGDIKVVDVNIRRLRKKLEPIPSNPAFIQTYWGKGYVWVEDGR